METTLSAFETGRKYTKLTYGNINAAKNKRKIVKAAKSFQDMLKVCTSDTKNQRLFVEVQVSESEALVWQKREKPTEIEYRKPDMTPEKSVTSNHTSPI